MKIPGPAFHVASSAAIIPVQSEKNLPVLTDGRGPGLSPLSEKGIALS